MNKRSPIQLVIAILILSTIGMVLLRIFIDYDLTNRLPEFKSFRQQNLAASSVITPEIWKSLGFWRWGLTESDSPNHAIYTSYPLFSYAAKAALLAAGANNTIASVLLGLATLFCISILLYIAITPSIKEAGESGAGKLLGLGVAPSAILMTNPSLLGIIPEPDWQESFLLFSCLALAIHSIKKYKTSLATLVFAFAIYFPAALSALTCKCIEIFANASLRKKQTPVPDNSHYRKNIEGCPNEAKTGRGLPVAWCALLGACLYYAWRRAAEYSCSLHLLQISGSSLLTRIGLDPNDTNYGGALSLLRIFTPIPNRLTVSPDFSLSIGNFYSYLNQSTLLISHGLISIASILTVLCVLTKASSKVNEYQDFSRVRTVLVFFCICTVPLLFILPQTMSVHFRLTDRLISPLTAIGASLFINITSRRISGSHRQRQLIFSLITTLVCIDQVRYFFAFYFPHSTMN